MRIASDDELAGYRDAEERHEREYGFVPGDRCQECDSSDLEAMDYEYGTDGDGFRGVRVKGFECGECGAEVVG